MESKAKFAVETYAEVIGDLRPLLELHWREIALFQDDIPLDPDWEFYSKANAAGLVRCYTARLDGALIGYTIFVVRDRHPHYNHRWAVEDIVWIHPDHRNLGVATGLFDFFETDLRKGGPVVLHLTTKIAHPALAVLLGLRGYDEVERGFSKRLT